MINQLEKELNSLIAPVLPSMTFYELNRRNERIGHITRLLEIMQAISSAISKRKLRGANDKDIQNYKDHLTRDVWKNSDIIVSYIETI